MVETAVINTSILTVTLTFLGFSILTLEKLVGFFYHKAYRRYALELGQKDIETPLIDEGRQEMVWPKFQLAFVLLLFICGLFSSPTSQKHVAKETKTKTGENRTGVTRLQKKNKRGNKNRKRMRRRISTRSKKR